MRSASGAVIGAAGRVAEVDRRGSWLGAPLARGLVQKDAARDGGVERFDRDRGMGMVIAGVARQRISAGMPLPSLPMIRAMGRVRSCCARDSPCAATAARIVILSLSAEQRARLPGGDSAGERPIRRRRAGLSGSMADGSGKGDEPVAPKASAERMSVPRLPGSCRPAAISMSGRGPFEHLSQGEGGRFDEGGDALRGFGMDGARENLRGKRENFCFFGEPRRSSSASLPDWMKTTARSSPLAMASSTRCSPSMARGRVRSVWLGRRLHAIPSPAAFCRLCTMRIGARG